MSADLHAIWLDDLAPGEGATPIWDEAFADTDDETRLYLRSLMTSGPVEPVVVLTDADFTPEMKAEALGWAELTLPAAAEIWPEWEGAVTPTAIAVFPPASTPKPRPVAKKPAKKATRKPKSPLAGAEARLRTVKGRMADEFKTLGGGA